MSSNGGPSTPPTSDNFHSSSTERHSYPNNTASKAPNSNRRNVHSSPAPLASSSTASPAETVPPATGINIYSPGAQPTARDALEREAANRLLQARAEHAAMVTQNEHHEPEETPSAESKRSCTKSLEFDFTYSNVYTSGSPHGRQTISSPMGAPTGCDLM